MLIVTFKIKTGAIFSRGNVR